LGRDRAGYPEARRHGEAQGVCGGRHVSRDQPDRGRDSYLVKEYVKTLGLTADQGLQMLKDLHPLGNPGEPIDIAYGVLYLASDESKFVTGSELVIDGGYTAK